MHIEDHAVRYWVHRIYNISRNIQLSIETSHIPYNFISIEGEEIEVPHDPSEILRVRHPDMGVTCTFQYTNINSTEKEFRAIYNYFSSLSHVDDILGLVNRELDSLHQKHGELIECHKAHIEGKFIHADHLHRFGSKSFVEKQFKKFEEERDLLQGRIKMAMKLVDDTSMDALRVGVNTATGYGYPMYRRPDYMSPFGEGGITDDDLPF